MDDVFEVTVCAAPDAEDGAGADIKGTTGVAEAGGCASGCGLVFDANCCIAALD